VLVEVDPTTGLATGVDRLLLAERDLAAYA
jgi:hypothetical protein